MEKHDENRLGICSAAFPAVGSKRSRLVWQDTIRCILRVGRKLFGDCVCVNPMRFAVCVPVESGPDTQEKITLARVLEV